MSIRTHLTVLVSALGIVAAGGCKKEEKKKAEPKAEPAPAPKEEPKPEPTPPPTAENKLYLDVHDVGKGKVTAAALAEAHKKDLEVQGKHNVNYKSYWFNEKEGKVYCLVEAPSAEAANTVHKESHGLVANSVMQVSEAAADGQGKPKGGMKLFMDVHKVGPGKVTAAAVAEAHKKDLATQDKYKVNYLNYWLDEESGTIMCLAEAPNAEAAAKTHKEAHGLVANEIYEVSEGH